MVPPFHRWPARVKELLSAEEIRHGVSRMAGEISEVYRDQPLTIVAVLTGSIVFVADLIRHLNMPLRVGLVQASSYRGAATSPSELTINAELLPDVRGRHVLLADDIFDTGHTLKRLIDELGGHRPESVRSAVLLSKQDRQEVAMRPDFVGFEIPDSFVVGYGLDYNDMYRNLPYVGTLDDSDLAEGGSS